MRSLVCTSWIRVAGNRRHGRLVGEDFYEVDVDPISPRIQRKAS
jgi:hypothetical protein